MTDDDARYALEKLVSKYLRGTPDFNNLMQLILNKNRPGLPVRGILEKIGSQLTHGYSSDDKILIQELLDHYG